jgi:hypothetical protein
VLHFALHAGLQLLQPRTKNLGVNFHVHVSACLLLLPRCCFSLEDLAASIEASAGNQSTTFDFQCMPGQLVNQKAVS